LRRRDYRLCGDEGVRASRHVCTGCLFRRQPLASRPSRPSACLACTR
jgi:hypothetical protein